MIKAGIIGGTGYVAGELLRCLVHHPEVDIDFIFSHSSAGEQVAIVHDDLLPRPGLTFTQKVNPDADVIFLCLGHGQSRRFLGEHTFSDETRIIDLGNDFRLDGDAGFAGHKFVYGLVEANREKITDAHAIANPGCFATAIQLALLPLAAAGQLDRDIHVHAITGSTGAGKGLRETTHFSWRNNNVSIYKPFSHQHLGEIYHTIKGLEESFNHTIHFLPVRGDFTRGIFASAYLESDLPEGELARLYAAYYKDAPFTWISDATVHLKQVVNTNHCFLQVQKLDGKVLITSVIDNLLKGAAGQAIQNMNLMFGFGETTGLQFKSTSF